ncbi:hypothetical protein GCM10029964_021800 [Kibdelosporangium lantanae]
MELNTRQRAPRLWLGLLIVVVVTAGLALGGRYLYHDRPPVLVGQAVVSDVPPGGRTAPSQPAAPESNTEVRASADAFQHPQYEQIHQMTQDYFNGVNQHDYNMFKSTLTAQRIGAMPASKFNSDFRSSHDTDIQIYRIEAAPEGRLRMMLGFTSTQDLADAPPKLQATCIQWRTVWPLVRENNRWKLDSGPEATAPQAEACPSR